jgi:hypothetical protein
MINVTFNEEEMFDIELDAAEAVRLDAAVKKLAKLAKTTPQILAQTIVSKIRAGRGNLDRAISGISA